MPQTEPERYGTENAKHIRSLKLSMNAALVDPASLWAHVRKEIIERPQWLATPQEMLTGRRRHLTLQIYGRKAKSRVAEAVARCYADPQRPLKAVAVEPLSGGRKPQAFFPTCPLDSIKQILRRTVCSTGHAGFSCD